MKTVGEYMREAREAAGLTQRQLACRSGISLRMIWAYESDKSFPGALSLIDLADALEISIDDYIGHRVARQAVKGDS